jgi:hypothetical protein
MTDDRLTLACESADEEVIASHVAVLAVRARKPHGRRERIGAERDSRAAADWTVPRVLRLLESDVRPGDFPEDVRGRLADKLRGEALPAGPMFWLVLRIVAWLVEWYFSDRSKSWRAASQARRAGG